MDRLVGMLWTELFRRPETGPLGSAGPPGALGTPGPCSFARTTRARASMPAQGLRPETADRFLTEFQPKTAKKADKRARFPGGHSDSIPLAVCESG